MHTKLWMEICLVCEFPSNTDVFLTLAVSGLCPQIKFYGMYELTSAFMVTVEGKKSIMIVVQGPPISSSGTALMAALDSGRSLPAGKQGIQDSGVSRADSGIKYHLD